MIKRYSSALFILLLLTFICGSISYSQEFTLDNETEFNDLDDQDTDESTDIEEFNLDDTDMMTPAIPELTLSLYDVWFNRYEILRGSSFDQNKMKRAEEEFKRFNESRLDRGIKKPKLFSAAMTREGYQYLWNDDPISAIDSFTKAISLDPTNAEAYYGRGKAYFAKSKLSIGTAVFDMIMGYSAQFNDFWLRFFYLGNLFFTVLIGISIWLISLIIVLLIKYSGLFIHDISELIPLKLSTTVVGVIAWTILFIPLFLGKGIILLLLFWLVLIWVYLDKKEKIISFLFLILLYSFPFLINYGISFFQMYDNRQPHAVLATYYGGWDPEVVQFLSSWCDDHPSDMEPYFLLGMMHRKNGDYYRAKDEYEKALRLDRSNAKVYNNLGNIYYFLNDYQQAISYYKKAISYDFELASPHYNLSKAYLALFEFKKADEELSSAHQLNKPQISNAERLYSPNPNRKLIDEYIHPTQVWTYFDQANQENSIQADELWGLFTIGIPLNQTHVYAITIAIIIFVISFIREKIGYARHCLMCGAATCKKCQRQIQSEKYCSHCMQLFIKKDGVDPQMRNEKMLQVHKYKKKVGFVSRILSLILPGWGHLYSDYPVQGSLISLLWILLLSRWFYGGKVFNYPYLVTVEKNFIMSGLIILLLIIIYLASNMHLSKVSGTN